MFLFCYSPLSSGAKIQVGRELKFTWLFWFTEGTPPERQLGAVALIACSGPRQHPPAFSCCSATLKIHNVPIQITKIIKLLLAEVSNFVLFLFSTSVAASSHNTTFASNVLIKRKCKGYTCLNHEICTHFSVCHLKSGNIKNQVSPLSSIYGKNTWRLFKGYLQA